MRRKNKIKLWFLSAFTIIILVTALFIIKNNFKGGSTNEELKNNIYNYLSNKNNRINTYNQAVKLNGNSSSNACVFFVSQVLRNNNMTVPDSVCNTAGLISYLKDKGWKKNTDFKALKPGNICFTTDEKGNKDGIPSHTYIFMKWQKEGSYDYAYICDNQSKDYENMIYHLRNIKDVGNVKNIPKDAFSFFME